MQSKDIERITVEVTRRVYERTLARADSSRNAYLDNLVHEVFYYETRRLDTDQQAVNAKEDRRHLNNLQNRMKSASESEKKQIAEEIIRHHVSEIVGHFDQPTYDISTRILPRALGILLNGLSPLKLVNHFPHLPDVADNIHLGGDIQQLHRLRKKGILIFVPTHSSNLDSIIAGYAIYMANLPPVCYGAGLNLFYNKFLGFFMQRLGAYKVDRRKKHRLYKEILKEYATTSMELGYDNLFFPGGTRSRSGAIEKKLKLGLLGCGLSALINNFANASQKPNVYIVPCTINYQLVLEAETLIEDHLKEAGKSRFIIEDDEFSKLDRIWSFMRNLVRMDASIYFNFGQPLDPFGNVVDEHGNSIDGTGRPIDLKRYVMQDGQIISEPMRDAQYTRDLASKLTQSLATDSVISSTHVLAWTVFQKLLDIKPDPDFYRFLRQTAAEASLPMPTVYRSTDQTLSQLRNLEKLGEIKLAETPLNRSAQDVVDRALRLFGSYHFKPVLERRGDRLFVGDMNLLYYYRNRLWGYELES